MTEQTPALEPRVGREVIAGRYRIDSLIARGGMAEVYLAEQLNLRRKVAIKMLAPRGGPDADDFEGRFQLEAETLAGLNHPNIVILHDYGMTADSRYYLVMEYVDGPRFTDLLKAGRLGVEQVIDLILQVCSALSYAHRRGVVHRDLKPSNLLVSEEDGRARVKVVDFGLARLTDEQGLTLSGMILGSPHCMSPEAIEGAPDIDARADIYSLGILLFRSLTGRYPFHGPTSAATMIAHLKQPVPTFYDVCPELEVPAGLEAVVRRCLERDPAARFQDVSALSEALSAFRSVPPEALESAGVTRPTIARAAPPRRARTYMGIAAAALAVTLAIASWIARGSGGVDSAASAAPARDKVVASTSPASAPAGSDVSGAAPDGAAAVPAGAPGGGEAAGEQAGVPGTSPDASAELAAGSGAGISGPRDPAPADGSAATGGSQPAADAAGSAAAAEPAGAEPAGGTASAGAEPAGRAAAAEVAGGAGAAGAELAGEVAGGAGAAGGAGSAGEAAGGAPAAQPAGAEPSGSAEPAVDAELAGVAADPAAQPDPGELGDILPNPY